MADYKKATRLKLRFSTVYGEISVEKLWDLDVEELDTLAVELDEELDKEPRRSYIKTQSEKNSILTLKRDIVVDVLKTLLHEQEEARNKALREAKKQRIAELIEKKKEQELESLSLEELKRMLEE